MRKLFYYSAILFAFSSCTQYRFVYSSAKINAPMLQEKNDSRINGSFSFGVAHGGGGDSSKNLGYDIQGAYALTNHFAVMGSIYNRTEADLFDSVGTTSGIWDRTPFRFSHVTYKRNFYELGGGYYNRFSRDFVFSVYGGMARGNFKIIDSGRTKTGAYQRDFSADVWKYFIQPGISFKSKVDFTMRFTCVQNRNINTTYQDDELLQLWLPNLGSSSLWFFEPSMTYQIPVQKWLNIETSCSMAIHDSRRYVRAWNISAGITLNPSMALANKSKVKIKK